MASSRLKPQWVPTPLFPDDAMAKRPPRLAQPPLRGWRRVLSVVALALRWGLDEAHHRLQRWLGLKQDRSAAEAQKIRQFAERLGGMWVILAHLASLGDELWGTAFCRELRAARDHGSPVPMPVVRGIIDEALRPLGSSFAAAFSSFDETATACSSFSQLHRARLAATGDEVMVRVRVPYAEERAAIDWRCMCAIAAIMKRFGVDPRLLLDDLFFEVKLATDDLLDFRTEIAELKKIRHILRHRGVYVPRIFSDISAERILVVEYVNGVSISELIEAKQTHHARYKEWLAENRIKRGRVWRRLFNMHQELLFGHGLFYTEMFSQNILLLKGNRIALVGGTIGIIDAELKRTYMQFQRSVLERDFTKATETYLAMGPALPYKDLTGMQLSVGRALRHWESRSYVRKRRYGEKSMAAAVGIVARCASEQGLPKLWNLARLQKAEDILGDSLTFLDRAKNTITALRQYEALSQIRAIKQVFAARKRKAQTSNTTDMVKLNEQLLENFEHDGKYLRQRLIGFKGSMNRASQVFGRILRITSNFIIIMFGIEAFILIRQAYFEPIPGVAHGPLGRFFKILQVQNKAVLVGLAIGLFIFSNFLQRTARQLFAKEIRPTDVV